MNADDAMLPGFVRAFSHQRGAAMRGNDGGAVVLLNVTRHVA